jgi:hypothetical protein
MQLIPQETVRQVLQVIALQLLLHPVHNLIQHRVLIHGLHQQGLLQFLLLLLALEVMGSQHLLIIVFVQAY